MSIEVALGYSTLMSMQVFYECNKRGEKAGKKNKFVKNPKSFRSPVLQNSYLVHSNF